MTITKINESFHETSQAAWEWINEYLAFTADTIHERNGVRYTSEVISYDNFLHIHTNWVDPEFNFGNMFGYTKHKWSKLKSNYINWDFLELAKTEIAGREKRRQFHYNLTIPFNNAHGSGKGCLLSLTFTRQANQDAPSLIMTVRASEVTKRLLFDFLLVQRIAEYVYGGNRTTSLKLYCPSMYISTYTFLMYHIHRPLPMLAKKWKAQGLPFTDKLLGELDKYLNNPPDFVKYKLQQRVSYQLHRNKPGSTLPKMPPLLVKDLLLMDEIIPYPADCITLKQRKAFKREYLSPK